MKCCEHFARTWRADAEPVKRNRVTDEHAMLKPGEIRGWVIDMDGCDVEALPPLSAAEAERAERFHGEDVRRRYAAAHRALRHILASHNLPTAIERNQRGKPCLPDCDHQFSLSRSGSR